MIQAIQYIVYDLTIPDREERRRQARVYESGRKLSDAIGIEQWSIAGYTDPLSRKQFFSEKLNKAFAIRVARARQIVKPTRQGVYYLKGRKSVPGRKAVPDAIKAQIRADRSKGASIEDLKAKYNLSMGSVYKALKNKSSH